MCKGLGGLRSAGHGKKYPSDLGLRGVPVRVSVRGFEPKSGVGGGRVLAFFSSHLQPACFRELAVFVYKNGSGLGAGLAAIPLLSPASRAENALLSPTGTREACWFGVTPENPREE